MDTNPIRNVRDLVHGPSRGPSPNQLQQPKQFCGPRPASATLTEPSQGSGGQPIQILTTRKFAESLTQGNLTLCNKHKNPIYVLAQESLQGNIYKFLAGNDADWTINLCQLPMFACAEIQRWVVIGPLKNDIQVRLFYMTLLQAAKGMSFNLPQPEIVDLIDTNVRAYSSYLDQAINEMDPSFILCIIPKLHSDYYNVIKRQLCINRSVPSQIVSLKKIKIKNYLSFFIKMSIQINCNLGGAPWRVVIPENKMMIVGFNVCYSKQNKHESYGALIATMNDTHTAYFNCVQKYENREELSNNFAMSIAKALNKFRSKNNILPNSIVIYRDGVGDGQLSYVHETEIDMVKRRFQQEFYGEKKVGLAFVIVKKRSNRIIYFNNHNKYLYPPPGTIIDKTVTDPSM